VKYAIIDGIKTEAYKGAKGICPICSSELMAKCGEFKMNHWAHKSNRDCDPWWEPETEWHRSWKNNFPVEWQEFSFIDEQNGEKHRADIHTDDKLVIEFQYSSLNPNERRAREKFYKNMVWVINGTRLIRDVPRFLKGKSDFRNTEMHNIFLTETLFLDECFPSAWIESSVPVIFDFLGPEPLDKPTDMANLLYCLFPIRIGHDSIVAEIPRKAFINSVSNGDWSLRISNFMDKLKNEEKERQKRVADQQQLTASMLLERFIRYSLPKNRRRRF